MLICQENVRELNTQYTGNVTFTKFDPQAKTTTTKKRYCNNTATILHSNVQKKTKKNRSFSLSKVPVKPSTERGLINTGNQAIMAL